MGDRGRWARRAAGIVAAGILFAVVVVEIQIALGFNLDSPFFRSPGVAIGFAVAALAFAVYQARPTAMRAGVGAGIALFGLAVLPFSTPKLLCSLRANETRRHGAPRRSFRLCRYRR